MVGQASRSGGHNRNLPVAVVSFAIVATLSTEASMSDAVAANWFDTVPSQCASNLSTSIVSGGPLSQLTAPSPRASFAGSAGLYRLVYILSSDDLPNPSVHYQTTVLTLDNRAKDDLTIALQSAADRNPLPMFEGGAGIVLSIAPDVAGYTWDLVYNAAKSALGAEPIDIKGVVPLLAVGGEITRDTVIQRNQRQEPLADIFWYYRVSIGAEHRSVLLASCRMPVEVTFGVALTHESTNNKKIEFSSNMWNIYDIEDSKYDTPLRYKEQDPEWMYSDEVDSNGIILNSHRISSKDISGFGISWQTMSGGRWRFLSKGLTFE